MFLTVRLLIMNPAKGWSNEKGELNPIGKGDQHGKHLFFFFVFLLDAEP